MPLSAQPPSINSLTAAFAVCRSENSQSLSQPPTGTFSPNRPSGCFEKFAARVGAPSLSSPNSSPSIAWSGNASRSLFRISNSTSLSTAVTKSCGPLVSISSDIVQEQLRECLQAHPDVVGIYNMGAGNRGLINVLSADTRKGRVVIAHELTEHTRHALNAGILDAIIHQDAGHEVRSALRVLKAKIEKIPLAAGQDTIRIEIYLKENLS